MFNINDYVKIKNTNITGKILRKKSDLFLILSGTNKIYVNMEKLEPCKINKKDSSSVNLYLQDYKKDDLDQIMLRHQTKEEAISNLEKFIDKAICNKKYKIKIIHGKNGGILRNAVHEYLKNNPNVKSFDLGNYYEGSYGVTIAYLK